MPYHGNWLVVIWSCRTSLRAASSKDPLTRTSAYEVPQHEHGAVHPGAEGSIAYSELFPTGESKCTLRCTRAARGNQITNKNDIVAACKWRRESPLFTRLSQCHSVAYRIILNSDINGILKLSVSPCTNQPQSIAARVMG